VRASDFPNKTQHGDSKPGITHQFIKQRAVHNKYLTLHAISLQMSAYKFRVLLDNENDAEIFRDIVIDQKANFEAFYRAITEAFEFSDEHMASFYASNENWDKGEEISLVDVNFDPDAEPVGLMSDLNLEDRIQETGQKFILVHDFMSMWIFLIELLAFVDEVVDKPYVALAIGTAPKEESRQQFQDFEEEYLYDDEEDEFGEFSDEDYDMDEFDEGFQQYDENDY